MKLTALLLIAAVSASAGDFQLPAEFGQFAAAAKKMERIPQRPVEFAAAPAPAPAAQAPVNQGFLGLGAAGKTGRIAGPSLFGLPVGNGTYRVLENGPWQVVLVVKTGFVDGKFTIKRDPNTGKDTLGFNGTAWDSARGAMGAPGNSMDGGRIAYSPATDSGEISWKLNGAPQKDKFKGGRAGSRGMSITLGGNNHDFTQD
jgi:hypothetical protein